MDFLKLLGVDPASIQKQVNEAGEKMTAVIRHFDERINQVDAKIDLLNKKLDALHASVILAMNIPEQDPEDFEDGNTKTVIYNG